MNKITRVLGASLGAAALVGTSAVAANAHDGGYGHSRHGHYGTYSVRGVHQEFSNFSHHQGRGGDDDFAVGRDFNHRWFKQHWAGHHHRHLTFAQKQAAIVARLTNADARLTALIAKVSDAASSNPDGWAAQALPYLQAQQSKLETLIAAVKAATNQQELADAFKAAFTPPTTPTPTPAPTSSPSPSTAPTA